ncbi:phosphodiesterase [Mycobacterium sp. AMU20-3851]|uniref:phosphodiesterase n=1 Tax=Mycobacterium sp. AMU20-3851 TaxID=3122055 RepID=UPI0037546493
MKVSEVAALPIRAGAAIRHARLFHPVGVLCSGTVRRTAATGRGLPLPDGEVVGRFSKGAGTPASLPDFAGLAWRTHAEGDSCPWDVLMVSAATRVVLAPTTSWSSAVFSTLMPLGYRGHVYWLRARLSSPTEFHGLSVDGMRDRLQAGPVVLDVEQAQGTGGFDPLAVIEFDRVAETTWPPNDIAFDPTLNLADGVSLLPRWLTSVRRRAYRSSREGRDAD